MIVSICGVYGYSRVEARIRMFEELIGLKQVQPNLDQGNRPFRFINAWWSHPGFMVVMGHMWSEANDQLPSKFNLLKKLSLLRRLLSWWIKESFGNVNACIDSIESELDDLDKIADERVLSPEELRRVTILFSPACISSILNLKRCLRIFEAISGLCIKFYKSSVTGVGLKQHVVEDFAGRLHSQAEKFPFTYLGFPLDANIKRIAAWNPVVEKFKGRLQSWKGRFLSLGGSLWRWLKSSLQSCRIFFGMGQNLLGGYAWLLGYVTPVAKLWKDLIRAKYAESSSALCPVSNMCLCSPWSKDIVISGSNCSQSGIPLIQGSCLKLGSRNKAKFWLDDWTGQGTLKDCFSRLFMISLCKEATVQDCLTPTCHVLYWEISWHRQLRDWELASVDKMRAIVNSVPLVPSQVGQRWWLQN
ncbi:hypothetical protein Tsubulata_008824 [Turnera subulata]|uniref:Reverse transcriptase zinc-binding domain-containing protein n=1 Tax=Turnera subulata TaxID=218843 RepID=A0A9Q0J195_9ROSI|nr:hypothetical protein Tsubulata_008824 [Turnera subulata]